jgi:hypothetical protein
MTSPRAARFFTIVGLHPPYALAILGVVVGLGVWTTSVDPRELDSGLGMVLFVQMFLASSGFLIRARRGHFDPLLAGGRGRAGVLMWHWIVSVTPGVAAWLCLAGTGSALGSPAAPSAMIGGRAAALFIVSAVAWTAGFALARGAAGVVWIAALLGLLLRRTDLLVAAPAVSWPSLVALRHAVTLVVCPFLLIGNHLLLAPGAICGATLLAAVPLLIVLRQSGGLDIYLVDRA